MTGSEHYTSGMSYTALARRYRSTGFDDIVGQEPIAKTLQAAIKADRVAHAYLFTGTRGVGKTTMARVFAKALNEGGDEVEKAIMSGQDTDVIEIDGASNNSVDDARELIANSVYRPMRGPYKIYIIDEVHMLSTAAFNALLKTMEEPPEHVKFILCTTEAHKVPPTIQSRCQRYDFRAIPMTVIADRLGFVVENEKLKAEPELLTMVARLGNGSMRDALSIMDRLMASGEKKLTVDLLESLMGLAPRELVGSLIDAFADGEPRPAHRGRAGRGGSVGDPWSLAVVVGTGSSWNSHPRDLAAAHRHRSWTSIASARLTPANRHLGGSHVFRRRTFPVRPVANSSHVTD